MDYPLYCSLGLIFPSPSALSITLFHPVNREESSHLVPSAFAQLVCLSGHFSTDPSLKNITGMFAGIKKVDQPLLVAGL